MKRTCILLVVTVFFSVTAYAQLKVTRMGESVEIDTSGFSPAMRSAYALMAQKCSRCHSIERIVVAVRTGVCPISKTKFNKKTSESVVARMYLKPDSNLSKQEARTILQFLNYLLEVNSSVAEK